VNDKKPDTAHSCARLGRLCIGTEDIYRIYAETFAAPQYLNWVPQESQALVVAMSTASESGRE
jgi:hypothetical protein